MFVVVAVADFSVNWEKMLEQAPRAPSMQKNNFGDYLGYYLYQDGVHCNRITL